MHPVNILRIRGFSIVLRHSNYNNRIISKSSLLFETPCIWFYCCCVATFSPVQGHYKQWRALMEAQGSAASLRFFEEKNSGMYIVFIVRLNRERAVKVGGTTD